MIKEIMKQTIRQFVEKNESDCIDSNEEELYNLCIDAVLAPPRVRQEVSSTLTSFTHFPMKPKGIWSLLSSLTRKSQFHQHLS